jgi:hypothetical protein
MTSLILAEVSGKQKGDPEAAPEVEWYCYFLSAGAVALLEAFVAAVGLPALLEAIL